MVIKVDEFGNEYQSIELLDDKTSGASLLDNSINKDKLSPVIASQIGIIGSGAIWFTNTPPTGWLICDGSAISRSVYSGLFSVIGTYWGIGDGSTTFNLPNFKGRVPVGVDSSQAEFISLGTTVGTKTHTLTTAEMPTHSHTITDLGHSHSVNATNGVGTIASGLLNSIGTLIGFFTSSSTTGITINNEGSNQPHNNLQPSLCINIIIKY